MNFKGLIIGLVTFIIIGVFHPLVIKAEYYFGKKSWVGFLVSGILFSGLSLYTEDLVSISFGVLGFSCFWSIMEIFEQVERVKQGRYPKNPKRKYDE